VYGIRPPTAGSANQPNRPTGLPGTPRPGGDAGHRHGAAGAPCARSAPAAIARTAASLNRPSLRSTEARNPEPAYLGLVAVGDEALGEPLRTPAISVNALAIPPPVHDSAVATLCRFATSAGRRGRRGVQGLDLCRHCLEFRPRQVIFIDDLRSGRPG